MRGQRTEDRGQSLRATRRDQPAQDLPEFACHLTETILPRDQTSRRSSLQPVLSLIEAAAGDDEESALIRTGVPSQTLGDICTDRIGGANELDTNRPDFELGPILDRFMDVVGQAGRKPVGDGASVFPSPHCLSHPVRGGDAPRSDLSSVACPLSSAC